MTTPTTPPPTIEFQPGESDAEYQLLLAAAFINHYAPDNEIFSSDYDENIDGTNLAKNLTDAASNLAHEREKLSMTFIGKIIQAGGEGEKPTVTIATTQHHLMRCTAIPFYKSATITVTPEP